MGLYTVEKKHIEQLDSGQLLRVLKCLLDFEAKECGISGAEISVPFNENDSDGGIDGWIRWNQGIESTPNIPNRYTGFQSKAMDMPAKECREELINSKGKIKPEIKNVLDADGFYVVFCRKAYTKSNIEDKIRKMAETLKRKGYTKKIAEQLKFYDGNRISNWVNQYFSVQVLVHEMLGRHPFSGLQTWKKWNETENKYTYFSNQTVKVWISQIQKAIGTSTKNIIRVTGLSGLGKTRLVLEALKPSEANSDPMQIGISDSVVYYENGSNENILQFVIDNRGSKNTTFVIDECTETLHAKLARQALSDDSNINLITICNEPDYARANAPQAIVLAPDNFKDVVSDLLKDAYKDKLSNLTFPIYTVKKHD